MIPPKKLLAGVACAAMALPPLFAGTPDENAAALGKMKIDHGTITYSNRETAPCLAAPDGKTHPNLPPRTVVKMVLNPAPGSNINVELWLPDAEKWNGRFLGLGNSGAAGHIDPGNLTGPVINGYAVATTDMGTAPNSDSGIGNREVWKDFGFRATHLMTVAAKEAIRAFYGKSPEYSYFSGGSTGGQQALQEAQRYPEDYDGIAAAIPAHCRTPLHAYFLWNHQILTRCPFTKEQEAAVVAAGNEVMARREPPPIAGKFVSDPRRSAQDIEAVIQLAMQKAPSLTPAHAEALRKLFDGPRHALTGERIFNGLPFGAGFDIAKGNLYLFRWVFGAKKNLMEINFGEDIDAYTAALGPWLNAENPDLSAFQRRGGKLVMNSGAVDSCVPTSATLDYYERAAETLGGLDRLQTFFRLYIIPGMSHGGGPGINQPPSLLGAVVAWREKGIVPDELTGWRVADGKRELEMPLFPYPSRTGWDAKTGTFQREEGPRGGFERVAARFRPAPAE